LVNGLNGSSGSSNRPSTFVGATTLVAVVGGKPSSFDKCNILCVSY
jgi:hypothetical protein